MRDPSSMMPNLANTLLALPFMPTDSFPTYLTQWQPGVTPLSTTPVVLSVIAGYLATIFTIRYLLKDKQAYVLNTWFRAHNIVLSVGSGLLLALMAEEIGPLVWKHGFRWAICDSAAWTPRMEFYYIINYYIKYVELIDTVFLALKKKPLAFLHVFHHAATALLCYNQLNGKTSVSWTVITLNLAVHVVMYYYYYGTAGGRRFWWKRHVTTMQITQFIIDLCIVYYATFQLFAFRDQAKYPWLPSVRADCAGTKDAAIFGCGLLSSYLFLFIEFFIRTYIIKGNKSARSASGAAKHSAKKVANGVSNGHAYANGNGVAKKADL
ncbi:Putative elongation of fatty acids protein 1 {ECO:0000250/UniProtKB:P40319} {ECO:0000250/UniProtKB:P40319}; AltName: Full=3-keto acyl-CoA synthase SPAC1B2.03c {ECO:0000250/UniProtKB:P40319}; AltName: Full=Very-long-chain 3-oxoacyl-CoA synthase 1 {ECO:0000250/UniProtKB:P40319} [Serendipita indica DSM 11827]|nr:Putative elongation of fatty acids protein 1 {ECO:0000250/UniProtKB:P40319} {ECO:0000250/UniProtKB:P40319}; AltName: Full=3-keto acyl-CoA synthase SPAC1B2.03c {ECO:0000250/UniProtKB:P40319}; AltName: Full=Very-long-chain 3-oxoacyl-CoA synthase 1 {ECO:0000250/UniProtKB:P40319} [Serendipita indica DSM 11827]